MARSLLPAVVLVLLLGAGGCAGSASGGGPATTSDGSGSSTSTPAAAPSLDACALLPQSLAEQAIERKVRLTTSSTPGSGECLYQSAGEDDPPYAVDLDVSAGTAEALAKARDAYETAGLEITDERGMGDGAFSGVNITSVSLDCVKNGVLHDISVTAPPFPSEAVAANAALALRGARKLGARLCAP